MILPNILTNQSSPAGLIGTRNQETAPLVSETAPEFNTRRGQIERVIQEIEPLEVRQIIGVVFQDLLRLLECLELAEGHLRQLDAADETFALFQLIRDEARVLVDFIKTDGLNCTVMTAELADALDGITFAINHDLQRVFERNSRHSRTPHAVVSELYRAHDVLTNCLQQSTITLAMVFNPNLESRSLFNDSDMRYRQSLQLCQDLCELIQIVENTEYAWEEPSVLTLVAGIKKFRQESMECLMYSDWPQFEGFCERINLRTAEYLELQPVLHQFRCYLETLLAQVRMRAVLASVFPVQFGEDSRTVMDAFGDNTASFSSAADLQEDNEAWSTLAVAV
ncbi:MAG: hypothetical protein M3R69_18915 [Acidobacteriota bacterium]|nr:hypothetical protein [Acidobacteriota bacterium]